MSREVTFLELVARSAAALILVVGLIYVTFAVIKRLRDYLEGGTAPFERLLLPWRAGAVAGTGDGSPPARQARTRINVLDRARLSQEHCVYLIEVAGRRFLLGGGERLELLADMGYVGGTDGGAEDGGARGIAAEATATAGGGRLGSGAFARILEEAEHRD